VPLDSGETLPSEAGTRPHVGLSYLFKFWRADNSPLALASGGVEPYNGLCAFARERLAGRERELAR
jgi:hypothetical protein